MADIKWSAFSAGSSYASGDFLVGLIGGANIKLTFANLFNHIASPIVSTSTLSLAGGVFQVDSFGNLQIQSSTVIDSSGNGQFATITSDGGAFSTDGGGDVTCQTMNVQQSQYQSGGVQVVGSQQNAIANATNVTDVITQLNALLAACRTHGLIAT
jgi:hypothetical protein